MEEKHFVVRAFLETPAILDRGFLTLDALLAAMIFRQTEDPGRALTEIPLKRTGATWHGSAGFFEPGERTNACFVRSLSPSDLESGMWQPMKGKRGKKNKHPLFIDQSRNEEAHQWRRMNDEYDAVASASVTWFGCGDAARVRELLIGADPGVLNLAGVGKKVPQGYGRVSNIEIMEGDAMPDRSMMLKDGSPARPVPIDEWKAAGGRDDVRIRLDTFEPPYYSSDAVTCAVPRARFLTWLEIRRLGQ